MGRDFYKISYFWLPPIVWAALIFIFSSLPTIETFAIDWQDFVLKKSAHVIEYGIFASLTYRALNKGSGLEKERAAILGIVIATLYGITDEFHQAFVPGRESRARDVVFDTIGATLAVFYLWKLLPKAPKRLLNLAEKLDLT